MCMIVRCRVRGVFIRASISMEKLRVCGVARAGVMGDVVHLASRKRFVVCMHPEPSIMCRLTGVRHTGFRGREHAERIARDGE